MCGRVSQAYSVQDLLKQFTFKMGDLSAHKPRFNLAPTQDAIVIRSHDGQVQAEMMKWGLVPPWSKVDKYQPIINLRSETVLQKPAFNNLVQNTRCLVPVDGYFEWRTDKLTKGTVRKVPFRYQLKGAIGGLFSLAGLYQEVELESGKEVTAFCLITTEANEMASQVHNRMPVILSKDSEKVWLDPKARQMDYAALLAPYPSKEMVAYEVSSIVNSAKNDTPECIAPATVQRTCK